MNHLVYRYTVHGQLHSSNWAAQLEDHCQGEFVLETRTDPVTATSDERTAYQVKGVLGSGMHAVLMQSYKIGQMVVSEGIQRK